MQYLGDYDTVWSKQQNQTGTHTMNYPSIKTIMHGLRCTTETAQSIRATMKKEALDTYERLEKINDLIEGYGVEVSGGCDFRNGPPLVYVNMGDPYTVTVCYFNDHFRIVDCGTIVERNPSLFRD